MDISFFKIFNSFLNESVVDNGKIERALKGRYRVIINYIGDPEHGIAKGVRYIDPYALIITTAGNPALRAYQPMGDTASKVPSWKLFRLDRIKSWRETPYINKKPAPDFNQYDDKSASEVLMIANYTKGIGIPRNQLIKTTDKPLDKNKEPEIFKTDTEKNIERLRQQVKSPEYINVGDKGKTTQDRYKEVKSLANRSLSVYNKAKREGREDIAQKALSAFREAQALSNKYLAMYKKEVK